MDMDVCKLNDTSSCRVGSVGFVSVLFPFILPLYIVRTDEATGRRTKNLFPIKEGTI